ncbi:MAG: HAMP domain-containing histidine kinase [bacterium]|nr:HAMP domain-containing histidine kinase [bacterium]
MTEPQNSPKLRHSVFARLVMIMVTMAISLLMIVAGFYVVIVIPGAHRSLTKMVTAHARTIAQQQPDLETALEYASQLDMDIRYEGPDDNWTTDETMPTMAEAQAQMHSGPLSHLVGIFSSGRSYIIAHRGEGIYLFSHRYAGDFSLIHGKMLVGLLITMAVVFLAVYLVLKRALRPLKLLNKGVAQLSEGQLDVVVPRQSPDEFGVLTEAFNRMTQRVGNMVRARDQLLIDVSHELRSPLTRMKVALAMLPEGERRQSLEADIQEMSTMVTELLELHRLDSGVELATERLDLTATITELAESFQGQSPGLTIRVPDQEVFIAGEASRIRIVLRNLIENALKFSLPDSQAVEVLVAGNGIQTEVRVKDDGAGVPADQVSKLFEPFFRLDQSRSRQTGGYGLGLCMCKRIMEAHGGEISLENNSGRGVTLVLSFPAGE